MPAVSLAARLWATAVTALVGSIALLFVSIGTVNEVKIRGPLYQDIVMYKDLLADILPPPEYLIESYLTCFEILKADDKERGELVAKLGKLEEDFLARAKVWEQSLTHAGIRKSMLGEAIPAGKDFFGILKGSFLPPLKEGRMQEAQATLYGPLTQAYRTHRSAVDATVELSNAEVAVVESSADKTLSNNMRMLLLAAAGINVLVLVLTFFSIRSVLRPMNDLRAYAERVAKGDYDCTCQVCGAGEIGSLGSVLVDTVFKVKENIAHADEAKAMAQQEADKARASMAKAEEAKVEAAKATKQGMFQAALVLEKAVEIISTASGQLAAQIENSTRGAQAQASRATEVANSMQQMNEAVLEVAHNAAQSADISSSAQSKALEGAEVVREVTRGIGEVQSTAITLKDQMTDLGRQSENIGKILNVISDIADQTNLLALNAAIEAARAGDAGRGFAVVADEVRKLAEKTMVATKQVGEAILSVQHSTQANILNVDKAVLAIENATGLTSRSGVALDEIVHLVVKTSEQVQSIAAAAEQQSAASEEINRAVDEVNAVAGETSQAMGEAAVAVGELTRQSAELRSLIRSLKDDALRDEA